MLGRRCRGDALGEDTGDERGEAMQRGDRIGAKGKQGDLSSGIGDPLRKDEFPETVLQVGEGEREMAQEAGLRVTRPTGRGLAMTQDMAGKN